MDVIVSLMGKQILDNVSVVRSYNEKIILIDALLHAFHLSLVSATTHRPVAMNFIDGTRNQVERVISHLASNHR